MIAYSFDPTTGRLLGPVNCDESPLEPEEFLVPAFATTAEPPETVPEGAEARWDGVVWQVLTPPPPPPDPEPPVPTPEEIQAALTAVVQAHLDEYARSWGYDGIASAVTYAGEPAVPRFSAEGAALRAWRSHVWAACYELLAAVQAGTEPVPTEQELLWALPATPARPVV